MNRHRKMPENISTTVGQLNADFSGRKGTPDYNESKLYHIHRRNRAFVWSRAMQINLKDSMRQGYYIPSIICCVHIVCDGHGNHVERREIMDGGNRITTMRYILNESLETLSDADRRIVEAFPITVVLVRGLHPRQQREMFRRLNKNIKVSDGQLYAMSEEDSPLVQEAMAFLNADDYPLRAEITKHFGDTRDDDTSGKALLANAVAIISGIVHGVHFITKSFNRQEEGGFVESSEPISRDEIMYLMREIFHIFDMADTKCAIHGKRKHRGQFTVGKYLGAMIYDCLTSSEMDSIKEKWSNYIAKYRREMDGAEEAIKIGGAGNLTANKYKKICVKVAIYLRDNRLATDDDLSEIRHEVADDESFGTEMDADEEESDDE